MERRSFVRGIFEIAVGVFAIVGVIGSLYFGYRSLSQPGVQVKGIDTLNAATSQGNVITSEIRDAVTAADPVEALHRRGYAFETSEFRRALKNRDEKSAKLFCEGAGPAWIEIDSLPSGLSSQSIKVLRECQANFSTTYCNVAQDQELGLWDLEELIKDESEHGLVSLVCGSSFVSKVRQDAAKTIDRERAELRSRCDEAYAIFENISRDADSESWSSTSIADTMMNKHFSKFARSGLQGACLETFSLDFKKPRLEMYERWENGGKTKN